MSCTKSSIIPRTELPFGEFGDYCEDLYGHDHCVLRTQKGESTPDPAGERIQLGFLRIHGFTTKCGRRQGALQGYGQSQKWPGEAEVERTSIIHSFIRSVNDFGMLTLFL